jgi:hypothetical protein
MSTLHLFFCVPYAAPMLLALAKRSKKKIQTKLLIVAVNLLRFTYWRSEGAPLRL